MACKKTSEKKKRLTPDHLDADNKEGKLIACSDRTFCCEKEFNSGKCSCSRDGGAMTISPGLYQTIIQVSDISFSGTPSISIATTSASVRTTSGSRSSTPTSASTSRATSSTGSSAASQGTSAPSSSPTDSAEGSSSGDSGMPFPTKLGIGLGVSLGVLAILALVAAVFFLRRRKKTPSVASPVPQPEKGQPKAVISDGLHEVDPNGAAYQDSYLAMNRRVAV